MGGEGTAAKPRQVTVTLAGSVYAIRTDASEEYVSRLERFVNEKVEQVQPAHQRLAPRTAFALAALSIADELFSAEERRVELENAVRGRVDTMIARVDAALGRDAEKGG